MKLTPASAVISSLLVLGGCLATGYFAGSFSGPSVLLAAAPSTVSARSATATPGVPSAAPTPTVARPGLEGPAPVHRVSIHAPNSSIGAPLTLVALDDSGEEWAGTLSDGSKPRRYSAVVEADGTAQFVDLPYGDYELIGTHGQDRMRIQVPTDSVHFDERIADSFRVLGVEPGSLADAAGVLPGDVVVAVAGASLRTVEGVKNFTRIATADAPSMTVLRGDEEVEIAFVGLDGVHSSHGMRVEPCVAPLSRKVASTEAP